MNSLPSTAPSTVLPSAARWSGYAGLLPFAACLAVLLVAPQSEQAAWALRASVGYGAAILSFVGALHWAFALAGRLPGDLRTIGVAVLPALVAAVATVVGGQRGLALLIAGIGLFWIYEHRACGAQLPADYLALRRALSLSVCALLALTLFAADAAGLR